MRSAAAKAKVDAVLAEFDADAPLPTPALLTEFDADAPPPTPAPTRLLTSPPAPQKKKRARPVPKAITTDTAAAPSDADDSSSESEDSEAADNDAADVIGSATKTRKKPMPRISGPERVCVENWLQKLRKVSDSF